MVFDWLARWRSDKKTVAMSRRELADQIEAFLDGSAGPWDWDDLCTYRLTDPELEQVRQECCGVDERFPPTAPGQYCSDAGVAFLRAVINRLREGAA
jgi:hypothetical protein